MLSDRVRGIGMSPTLRIAALAGRLRAEGVDVLDFSAGEPDFPTPESVKLAGIRAIENNHTGYTANPGLIELRRAIADRIRQERGIAYEPEQVLVSPGAKASLYFAVMALVNDGDEVIVPRPYWVTYPEQIVLAGGTPRYVDCPEEDRFKLTVPRLAEAAANEKVRGVLLNYPSNPTGVSYSADELAALGEYCVERGLWIVADEIYSRLLYEGRSFTSIAAIDPRIAERTIVIDGMSKTYSMTGWRLGYATGPSEVISGMARLQSHATSNATSITQWAGIAALDLSQGELDQRTTEFQRRRDFLVDGLRALPGVSCVLPEGAFYAYPNVAGLFGEKHGIRSGSDLAEFLLERARVAVVPGEAFGTTEHIRLSYATSTERIREGLARIAAAIG